VVAAPLTEAVPDSDLGDLRKAPQVAGGRLSHALSVAPRPR
jgi:hypothetical protein